jgi:hypothetical protein
MGRIQQYKKKKRKDSLASLGNPFDTLLHALTAFRVLRSYFFVFPKWGSGVKWGSGGEFIEVVWTIHAHPLPTLLTYDPSY